MGKLAFLRQFARKLARREPPRQGVTFEAMAASAEQRTTWLDTDHYGLAKIYAEHRGRILHKWVHYLDTYERYFAAYVGRPVRMLEIGVSQGGSLEMWRRYFGPEAIIFGIDINPASATCVDPPNQVRIGSQADPQFLQAVIEEMGPPDIILDDGSHVAAHQTQSFRALFPLLTDGGVYVIEDLQTSYWSDTFQGGYQRSGTAIELAKQLVDDMHHWYHREEVAISSDVGSIHFHDAMVVIQKKASKQPMHLHVGREAPEDGSPPRNHALFPPR